MLAVEYCNPGHCTGVPVRHPHHACWYCGKNVCGFAQVDWYRCRRCQVEERGNYARDPVASSFDPGFAQQASSPA